ncbi:MAG: protease inhibitor I42 family protein [Clostridia bacterium]|nr:protease inhibitor I42 family protein [Clostridia bacterium]
MKKIASILMILVTLTMAFASFAGTEKESIFEVRIEGDVFTLTLDENPSTGYEWVYEIGDETHVSFVKSGFDSAETGLIGAGGQRTLTFKVLGEGVSTIHLDYKRSWEETSAEAVDVLVYQQGQKLIVEEDQEVHIVENQAFEGKCAMIDGKAMAPLREVLETLGYTVKWQASTQSVEINKGAQWTSITIGKNAYFKNKMAPQELSSAPVIREEMTYVPIEFFADTLGLSVVYTDGLLKIQEGLTASVEGFIQSMEMKDGEIATLVIGENMEADGMEGTTIVHISSEMTLMNTTLEIGKKVRVMTAPVMTMSLPPQTAGYIIY